MAEPFNPNEFRKKMAMGQGVDQAPQGIPAPVAPPQAPVSQTPPQIPGHPQQFVPPQPQGFPAQIRNPNMPQNYAPLPNQGSQQMPQAVAPMPAQNMPSQHVPAQSPMPAQHYAPASTQPYVPQHGQMPQGQPFQGQIQGGQNFQAPPIPSAEVQEPPKKRGLFRRKKLETAKAVAKEQASALGAKKGLSPILTFASGLVLGVLGTLVSIMVFSTSDAEQATVAVNSGAPAVEMVEAQEPLTDEMLLKEQEGNRE